MVKLPNGSTIEFGENMESEGIEFDYMVVEDDKDSEYPLTPLEELPDDDELDDDSEFDDDSDDELDEESETSDKSDKTEPNVN